MSSINIKSRKELLYEQIIGCSRFIRDYYNKKVKTTHYSIQHVLYRLLDVLAQRKDPAGLTDGLVLLDRNKLPENFRLISGYVVQVRFFSFSTCIKFCYFKTLFFAMIFIYLLEVLFQISNSKWNKQNHLG